ncbi:hypothetical protein Sango_1881300 [Sesamum angolense]|uniref:Reverse transcriptase/retrotransposon-derived protein RNase H-like domain-containing protein n=1 Tax=Sesamum angolense TaxID=2727404 RepID=A0AAE1WIK0_9LAMI|nr:hypothetical protein Sango_1881300 [Sesamum angolense]
MFEWDTSCQRAFEELKEYLAGLLLLVKPVQGDTLYLYISTTSQTVSSILIREERGKQMLIYYVSKLLNGAEGQNGSGYGNHSQTIVPLPPLTPYRRKTNMPLKQTFGKSNTSGRLVKRTVELSEYDISYLPCTTIKAQALIDFVSEIARAHMDASKVENSYYMWMDLPQLRVVMQA